MPQMGSMCRAGAPTFRLIVRIITKAMANRSAPPHICLVCPTMWDEAELPAIVAADRARVRTFGTDASEHPETFDADAFIEAAVAIIRAEGLEGVMATDDYPGSIVAAAIARELGV